jgi:hypothetical protein
VRLQDRRALAELIVGIVVHKDRLIVRLKPDSANEASDSANDQLLSIPWQKPPAKNPVRSCFHMVHLVAKSARHSSTTGRAWSALSREAVTGGRALITRIRTVWTQVDLRRVRAGVRLGRWRDAGAGVDLRIGRFILARVVLGTRCATRLPTATAIPAAPNRGARCAWDDVNPGSHRQCDAIRGRPDPGGRN